MSSTTFLDTIPDGDIIIEYGQPLDIWCVLNDEFVAKNGPNSSSRLSFTRGDDQLPDEMVPTFINKHYSYFISIITFCF